MKTFIGVMALLSVMFISCSPADWAAVQTAGAVAGDAVDVLALGRAEQIRLKTKAAEEAAARGDSFAAMRALNEALAEMAADQHRELADLRERCQEPRPPAVPAVPSAPPLPPAGPALPASSPAPAPAVSP